MKTLEEKDLDALPASKNGRKPELRGSDVENLAGVDTGRHTLSHTRVSVFLSCHRKFELEYLQRLEPVAPRTYLDMGSAYQKAIELQDPEAGVKLLNGYQPCDQCNGRGVLSIAEGEALYQGQDPVFAEDTFDLIGYVCPSCGRRGWSGGSIIFHTQEAEDRHRVNEAIVRAAATLHLKTWPSPPAGSVREFEYRIRLRSPWTGAYSNTYDLLGYADELIDPTIAAGRMGMGAQPVSMSGEPGGFQPISGFVDRLEAARAWERGDTPILTGIDEPLELVENKLVGRVEKAQVLSLPLNRQLALERYGVWRATGRHVNRVWYRWMKKPSIKQREGRKKDRSDAETLDQYLERIAADYEERPDFYLHQEEPKFVSTKDLLRIEADLWEWAEDVRQRMRLGGDGRRRVFDRNTDHCSNYGGCQFLPICTGDPEARSLYTARPERTGRESAPEAE